MSATHVYYLTYYAVFFSYATVSKTQVKLYIDKSRLTLDSLKALEDDQVILEPYENIMKQLHSEPLSAADEVSQ